MPISKSNVTLFTSLGFASGLLMAACVSNYDNPDHCRYAKGDQTCAERYGNERPYCTAAACDSTSEGFLGCVAEQPADDCYYACGGDNTVIDDDSCLLAGDGDGDPTGDGDGDGDPTGDGDGDTVCMGDEDCSDGAMPFCDLSSGECVSCDGTADPDGMCAGADPEHPLCVGGVCVACTENDPSACTGTTPICEVETSTCIGCVDHGQCPDSACNLAAGNCFDPANILHVDGDFVCAGADGSEGAPYCDIGDALANAPVEPLLVIHAQDLDTPYLETNLISNTVAMFAAAGEHPVLQGVNMSAPLTVAPSGLLFLRGVAMTGTQNGGEGLAITGGQAWIEQAKITNNAGGGILVDGGGTLVLENSFVGGDVSNKAAIDIVDGALQMSFTTVGSGFGTSAALRCTDGGATTVRNSLLVSASDADEVQCSGVSVTDSALEMSMGNNVALGALMADWFLDFDSGDFHLIPNMYPAAIDTAATWQTGDPPTDIDGDPRPTQDGTPDFAGADRTP
ncbi:hypothetical protein DB30_06239 [Enhygromyxa salina]|uniref:Right handed beta helix domain-containing protein n=1 Tax=Enhygromyxa salina TaxID=215803 RepID=A0A0C2D4B6_9BACT|nr:dickkopf-related protein [Enhygromyxa salina]KIG14937.1 hypothetical protein DB30_06239 [Enhygromyxa salina]